MKQRPTFVAQGKCGLVANSYMVWKTILTCLVWKKPHCI